MKEQKEESKKERREEESRKRPNKGQMEIVDGQTLKDGK